MKKTTFLLIFLALYSLKTSAMIEKIIVENTSKNILFGEKDLNKAAKKLSALIQESEHSKIITKSIKNLDLIKQWSKHFNCSDMKVVKALSVFIPQAYYRGLQQEKLYKLKLNAQELAVSKNAGLDLDFTYGNDQETALMRVISTYVLNEFEEAAVHLLVENGADINKPDKKSYNSVISAIRYYHQPIISLFLNHKNINVHYQDRYDNTLLHWCVHALLNIHPRRHNSGEAGYDFMGKNIQHLLTRGIDPTLRNKFNKTALEYALLYSGEQIDVHPSRYMRIIPNHIIGILFDAEIIWNKQHTNNLKKQ